MGYDITGRAGDGRTLGDVHFAGMAQQRQARAYGTSFTDCLTYGPDGDDTESVGAISNSEGAGWYRPRVGRCIARAEKLLEAVRAKPTHPLDGERVGALLTLLRAMKADRKAMMRLSF